MPTSPVGGLSFGATPIVDTEPDRTLRTSTSTVSFPTAETYIVRPSREKWTSCGLHVPLRPLGMHWPVAAPAQAALPRVAAWTIRYFRNGWLERRSTTSTEPCVRGLIMASQFPLGWIVELCAPPLGDAETQPRSEVVNLAVALLYWSRTRSTPPLAPFPCRQAEVEGLMPEVSGSKPIATRSPRTWTSFCQPGSVYCPAELGLAGSVTSKIFRPSPIVPRKA